jgi:hypothetical protein
MRQNLYVWIKSNSSMTLTEIARRASYSDAYVGTAIFGTFDILQAA